MSHKFASVLVLLASISAGVVSAQEFDDFRFVGENAPAGAGFVTNVSLDPSSDTASISFLNVAGLSKVYEVSLSPSEVIRSSMPVFMPPPGFSYVNPPALNLEGIDFFTGSLVDPDSNELPPHWFRLSRYNGRWSGAFRIADRIYAIDRDTDNNIVDVRYTPSRHSVFQPSRRVKISAVIDDNYLFTDNNNNLGHLHALESIHVMDGLLTDTLSMTVLLEQLIYQPAVALTSPTQLFDLQAGAQAWLNSNSTAFGLTDNIATLFFRGTTGIPASSDKHPDTGIVADNSIIQANNSSYQFSTAHYFGRLLGISEEPKTLQDWVTDGDEALAWAHWSDRQKEFLDFNPPAAALTQLLSYDAPEVAVQPPEEINQVDNLFVDSDTPEVNNQEPGLFNDPSAANASTTSGGGANGVDFFMLIIVLLWRQRSASDTKS